MRKQVQLFSFSFSPLSEVAAALFCAGNQSIFCAFPQSNPFHEKEGKKQGKLGKSDNVS